MARENNKRRIYKKEAMKIKNHIKLVDWKSANSFCLSASTHLKKWPSSAVETYGIPEREWRRLSKYDFDVLSSHFDKNEEIYRINDPSLPYTWEIPRLCTKIVINIDNYILTDKDFEI